MAKLGIEETKELLLPCMKLGEGIGKAFEDGKFTTWEGIMLSPKMLPIIKEAKDWREVIAEMKDIDPMEAEELKQFIRDNFDIAEDQLEARIEAGMFIVISLIAYLVATIN